MSIINVIELTVALTFLFIFFSVGSTAAIWLAVRTVKLDIAQKQAAGVVIGGYSVLIGQFIGAFVSEKIAAEAAKQAAKKTEN